MGKDESVGLLSRAKESRERGMPQAQEVCELEGASFQMSFFLCSMGLLD